MAAKAAAPAVPLVGRLTPEGLKVSKAALVKTIGEAGVNKLIRSLTVAEKITNSRVKGHFARAVFRSYYAHGPFLYLPQKYGQMLLSYGAIKQLIDERHTTYRKVAECTAPAEYDLWDYQLAAVDHLFATVFTPERALAGTAVAYQQLDPGLGKTFLGTEVVKRVRGPALLAVPTDAICGQWLDDFASQAPDLRCTKFSNTMLKWKRKDRIPSAENYDVVICIFDTLRKKGPDFVKGFALLMVDEAHELKSPENSNILWLGQTPYVLMLSGTPYYSPGGLDHGIVQHFGPVIWQNEIPGFNADEAKFTGEVWRIKYKGDPEHAKNVSTEAGTTSAIMTIGSLIRDAARLRLIAKTVREIHDLHETLPPEQLEEYGLGPHLGKIRRHGIFVFSEHRDYLPAIRKALLEFFSEDELLAPELAAPEAGPKDSKAGSKDSKDSKAGSKASPKKGKKPPPITILMGGAARDAPSRARKLGAHVVLTTYGFSRRGISLPDMTAIVLASPRRNGMSQILPRARRRGSDQTIRRITVDIVDVSTSLKSQAPDRAAAYKKFDYAIKERTAAHTDFEGHSQGGVAEEEAAPAATKTNLELLTELDIDQELDVGQLNSQGLAAVDRELADLLE